MRGIIFKAWAGWCGKCGGIQDIPDANYKRECERRLRKIGWKRDSKIGWLCPRCAKKTKTTPCPPTKEPT